jgi:hypothetical protein
MSSATTKRMGAVLGAGALGAFLLCAPVLAGPGNGHEKSSNGPTQGASQSNPDGGGVDKPYAAAGQEARSQGSSDWDGNNGCGNDDDREDDNNGWCGRKPGHDRDDEQASAKASGAKANDAEAKAAEARAAEANAKGANAKGANANGAATLTAEEPKLAAAGVPTEVLGVQVEAAAPAVAAAAATAPSTAAAAGSSGPAEVLGVQVTRGAALAATGVPVLALVLAGLALVVGGAGLRRLGRPRLHD